MYMQNMQYKDKDEHIEWLKAIVKDIERIMIYMSYFDFKYNLLTKLEILKSSLTNKLEKTVFKYENDNITMTDDYVIIHCFDSDKVIKMDNNIDIITGIEYIVLIKRNMKDFYFCDRKVLYKVQKDVYTYEKLKAIWCKEHYEIKDKNIKYKKINIDINELLDNKIYVTFEKNNVYMNESLNNKIYVKGSKR